MSDDLELDLHNALAVDLTIGPLITGADGTVRIYPVVLKQESAFPALTYDRISTQRNEQVGSYTHSAGASGYTGFGWARMQITVWSDEFSDLAVLGKAVRSLIHRISFAGARPANQVLLDFVSQEPERNVYQRIIDAKLWFQETP